MLDLNKKLWITNKFELNSLLLDIKLTCPTYFIQVHSQALQNVSDRLSKAFNNFFRKVKEQNTGKKVKAGFPRFKSKVRSITYPQSGFKFLKNRRLKVSKIGSMPIVFHRPPKGTIKTMTIKQNPAGQWFALFSCEQPDVQTKHPSTEHIGIDVGIESFAVLSNGESILNPKYLVRSAQKLRKLQKAVSRKVKGSANRRKAIHHLAVGHLKVLNQRTDFLHKISHRLTLQYNKISFEKLTIKNMVKNHNFAKSISDASWGTFVQFLSYKAVKCGGQVIVVNPRNTSKTCSNCKTIIEMPLSKRQFCCPSCGFTRHRDLNAALNIRNGMGGLPKTLTPADI